ncbi:hypothetical protein [Flavihumibacter fluvii]|uniref:hypothetical protein n=1 Tax=Flavihumibacter fluvii TaxID=2838157 RepID=UPI001BDEFD8E|nr:hypothetical protein [Flavihumibacter fluvii]ULQ51849.1 hypothetical protein KJS93_17310 [Flavihumibacter fluvii]
MKKIITAIVAMVILTATATFANGTNKNNNVEEQVERSFKKEFSNAENTSWTKINDIYKAQFVLNGQVMFAFLNEDGVLLGTYRNILSSQLPMPLMSTLKEDYSGYWITELLEVAKENQTNYYVTIENGDQKLTLKSENASSWFVKSKLRK